MPENTYRKYELAGWILFLLSAIAFTILGLIRWDLVSTVAGLLFLLACVVFLVPYWKGYK